MPKGGKLPAHCYLYIIELLEKNVIVLSKAFVLC